MGIRDILKHAWSPFSREPTTEIYSGRGTTYRPDTIIRSRGNERSIVTSVYNRIALDTCDLDIRHCKLDNDGRFSEIIDSSLNECLSVEANLDQTGRALIQDAVMTMLEEGVVAIVPVKTDKNPNITEAYNVEMLRSGKIVEWRPNYVVVRLYDQNTGEKNDVLVHKKYTTIVYNPFYSVMNSPNSTLQRLIRKLNILDAIDEQSGAGKLDLIIQLPYVVKTQARKDQAESRRQAIENQLKDSQYGIAYTEGAEKITQLNRPVDNNLMKQVEYLTSMLYSQLGITQSILDGTADEKTMLNYTVRTVGPIIKAIVEEMRRKFLTKTARTQGQTIRYFREPFSMVPANQLAEIAETFTRNEIASSNEFRQILGWKPSLDPRADELRNKNLNAPPDSQNTSDIALDNNEG